MDIQQRNKQKNMQRKKEVFEGKDFEDVYRINENIIYPVVGGTTKRYKQTWKMGSDRNE